MLMKRIFLLALVVLPLLAVHAQTSDADYPVCLSVMVPQSADVSPSVAKNLENKLNQIVLKNGMMVMPNGNFLLVAKIDVKTKDVTATAPPMVAYTIDVNLYVGDGVKGTLYNSMVVTLKGAGKTEEKALTSALNGLARQSYEAFFKTSKQKIVAYYQSQCKSMLSEAQNKSQQGEYDEALYTLSLIPTLCQSCRSQADKLTSTIYQDKIDTDGKQLLLSAKTAWSNGQDEASAEAAEEYLKQIDPHAACYQQAQGLVDDINAKFKADVDYSHKLAEKEADAVKEVAVAYAKSQPLYNYVVFW
jgi:hypothetical protein